jgi:hypothetical protein
LHSQLKMAQTLECIAALIHIAESLPSMPRFLRETAQGPVGLKTMPREKTQWNRAFVMIFSGFLS